MIDAPVISMLQKVLDALQVRSTLVIGQTPAGIAAAPSVAFDGDTSGSYFTGTIVDYALVYFNAATYESTDILTSSEINFFDQGDGVADLTFTARAASGDFAVWLLRYDSNNVGQWQLVADVTGLASYRDDNSSWMDYWPGASNRAKTLTSSDLVMSVNGQTPATSGDITLNANNVGAYTTGQTDSLLATKAASSHTHPASQISDSTATGRSIMTAANAAAVRTAAALGTIATQNANAVALTGGTFAGLSGGTIASGGFRVSSGGMVCASGNINIVGGLLDVQSNNTNDTIVQVGNFWNNGTGNPCGASIRLGQFSSGGTAAVLEGGYFSGTPSFRVKIGSTYVMTVNSGGLSDIASLTIPFMTILTPSTNDTIVRGLMVMNQGTGSSGASIALGQYVNAGQSSSVEGFYSSGWWFGVRTGASSARNLTLDPNGNLSVTGGCSIGGGTFILKVISSTATLDFPSIAAGSYSDLTISVTGATVGSTVDLASPATATNNVSYYGWVSATNTVTVRASNNHLTASQDPASGTFRASVFNF